jgi:hypothetical protein
MTPTTNVNPFDDLEPSDSDASPDTTNAKVEPKSERHSERPTRKKRFQGNAEDERTLLRTICKEALSDTPSRYRKAITTPRMIGKFRQKLQNEDITDDDLRKIATKVISSEYLDQHPDHPSEVVYQPGLLSQYGQTPGASQESVYTPARRTPREINVMTTTTKIAAIMQSMGADNTQARTQKDSFSPTVMAEPTIQTPPDTSVQNLEESFKDYATERSTPNSDATGTTNATNVQPLETSLQETATNAAIDMQITESLVTSGQEYIDGRIKTSITKYIESEEIQDQIRDVTNQHMKQFLDIRGSLQEEHLKLSDQVTSLKEQISEGFCLLAELKNTNQDLQQKNSQLKTTLQEATKEMDTISKQKIQTVAEQTELLTTRGLAKAEKLSLSALRTTTRNISDKCKEKINSKLASYDKIISDKYDEHIEKGTDLLYEMGNTIKTELDLVIEESSENIANLKNSATITSIIEQARITIENSWKPAHERQSKTIIAVRTSQNKLETIQRNQAVLLQRQMERQMDPQAHPDIKALEDRIENLEDGDMYPTNLNLDTQVTMRVTEAIREFKETIQEDMDVQLKTALAEMHRHTNSNDLTKIKADIAANMDNVIAHQMTTDSSIIQIRKNIAEHIESLVDKLHDQYMHPENPFTNSESSRQDESVDTPHMGAQPHHTPRKTANTGHYQSLTPQRIQMNDTRVELGLHNYKRDVWAHRLSDDPTRQEMEQFYDIVVNSSRAYQIPMLKREELKPRGSVYPQPKIISGECHDRISMLLYGKLLDTIPPECNNLHSVIGSFSSSQDGYSALFAIMRMKCTYLQDIQPLWGPTWAPNASPYLYLTALNSTLEEERRRYHNRTNFDIAAEILQQASQHDEYKLLATAYLTSLLPLVSQDKHQILPKEYQKENLINALSSYHRKPVAGGTGTGAFQINRFGAPTAGRGKTREPFRYKNEVQCTACKMFGHDIKLNVCRFCAQYHHTSRYATKFPEETLKNASAFASAQDKAKVNKAKVSFPNLFHPDMTEEDEMDALAHIAMVMYPDKQEE